jgi:Fe-S cluster biosynthesis and repair protein YggX
MRTVTIQVLEIVGADGEKIYQSLCDKHYYWIQRGAAKSMLINYKRATMASIPES